LVLAQSKKKIKQRVYDVSVAAGFLAAVAEVGDDEDEVNDNFARDADAVDVSFEMVPEEGTDDGETLFDSSLLLVVVVVGMVVVVAVVAGVGSIFRSGSINCLTMSSVTAFFRSWKPLTNFWRRSIVIFFRSPVSRCPDR
jgi:hypothetical protein